MSNTVKIWTDGSCNVKNRLGGCSFYMIHVESYNVLSFSKGYSNTTISRMELKAIIFALKVIEDKKTSITITSDSQYTVNSINKGWLLNWERENFNGRSNSDLWKEFLIEYRKFKYEPKFIHCRGHQGVLENEIADMLCDYKSFNEYEEDIIKV